MAPAQAVLNDSLGMAKLRNGALRRRPQRVVADIADGHAKVQTLTHFEDASRVIEHFADGQIKTIQLGAGRLSKRVENVHKCEDV